MRSRDPALGAFPESQTHNSKYWFCRENKALRGKKRAKAVKEILEGFAQKWFTQQLSGHVGRRDTVASLAFCVGFPGLQSLAVTCFPTAFCPPSRTPDA